MTNVRRIYVEKRKEYATEAHEIQTNLVEQLGLTIHSLRIVHRYDVQGISEEILQQGINTILAEPMVDHVYDETFPMSEKESVFAIEFLPGQYDQRADSCEQCFQILTGTSSTKVRCAKLIVVDIDKNEDVLNQIKHYLINPVDQRIASLEKPEHLNDETPDIKPVPTLTGFNDLDEAGLNQFLKDNGMAMNLDDLKVTQDYFKNEENRDPSITEIKVIDTYWSDHCRHTTFATTLEEVEIEENKYTVPIKKSYHAYMKSRDYVYGEDTERKVNLMDIAVIAMKEMRKKGMLDDLDVSDEINACSINIDVETDKGIEKYLLMFKNETHNHPTEIEPFGGAATCLGGAIRDPLSGRTFVYQAMRVTGAADPTVPVEETLKGKLPQRTITLGAAHGYSSYGNQIGLATGQVAEVYHPNYVAKRMEVGAVIAAAPKENVIREEPKKGDIVILLGGRTGRDGVGGATGSSKEHTTESIETCGAEVQKGNAPTERKIQRLFRNATVAKMIKRCNDFGAGGVSVAIGELCRGLDIDLDKVPKKYEGLDGTELAVSESQERMAVVVNEEDADKFIALSKEENLEAVKVAVVTDTERLRLFWRGKAIVDLKRSFLDTNGATQKTKVKVEAPIDYPYEVSDVDVKGEWIKNLHNLNVASQKGLVERFDSTIGAKTVLMPFGGKYAKTPAEGMAAKIPVWGGDSKNASLMTFGFNPYLGTWSPYHMAFYSVIESVTKLTAMGGDYRHARLTFQEYFERLGKNPSRWGKPFAALLGAYKAQEDLKIAAIGGKDSMSGTFDDIDVPPSLVSFAVGYEKADRVISPEFKEKNSKLVLLTVEKLEDGLINMDKFKKNMEIVYGLIGDKKIISASSTKMGGVSESLTKMALGNKIGCEFTNLSKEELFGYNYGTMVVEVKNDVNIEEAFKGALYKEIGKTTEEFKITSKDYDLSLNLDDLDKALEEKLNGVFKIKTEEVKEEGKAVNFECDKAPKAKVKVQNPKVVIPVFPGTNCEDDCQRAFEKEGAVVTQVLIRNLTKETLKESIDKLEEEIKTAQIIMIPGGFSAGDEPDGSGKFIATVFRNEKIKNAVMDLLNNRDGLILGICNGFQALIKLGLVPYGEIRDLEEDMPTLTYNNINRHMSSMIRTRISTKKSPWFSEVNLGDIHTVAISHGEGRFVASEELVKKLEENGQIATQYVDFNGNVSLNMPYNPNGSVYGIEGITSPDGRVLGKMGHSERIGENLYKNVPGDFDQKIFKSGVNYFR